MKHTLTPAAALALSAVLVLPGILSGAAAQQNAFSLERAVSTALAQNLEVANAANAAAQAGVTRGAREADPTALITDVLQAQHGAALAGANLGFVKLEVTGDTLNDFLNLAEVKDNLEFLASQAKLSERSLEIARARLNARTATPVDVQRAETELAGARQQLADAKAQRPIIALRLGRLLGLDKGVAPEITDPPALRVRSVNLAQLEDNLDERNPQVVQAAQAVEFGALIVKTSDNDYTPDQAKREAKTNLENANRALNTARRKAVSQLRDAFRGVQDALESQKVATQNEATAGRTLANDAVRLKNGLIAKVQLDASELAARRAALDAQRAANGYLRALAALSVASGSDVTGLVK